MKTASFALAVVLFSTLSLSAGEDAPKPSSAFDSIFQSAREKLDNASKTPKTDKPGEPEKNSALDLFRKMADSGLNSQSLANTVLSNTDIKRGLQEALTKGIKTAIAQLGKEDGYFKDVHVKIPLPEKLSYAEKPLRLLGQEKVVEEFVLRMNRAAEQAVPQVVDVFTTAVTEMTIEDAEGILGGGKRAATRYFRKTCGEQLHDKILPVVKKVTSDTGVTSTFKKFMSKANSVTSVTSVLGVADFDLDAYVTRKAIDGLFYMIGKEEEAIRENPAARTTQLLQRVFGSNAKK